MGYPDPYPYDFPSSAFRGYPGQWVRAETHATVLAERDRFKSLYVECGEQLDDYRDRLAAAESHRTELALAVKEAVAHERAMRAKQLAHGGWVDQVAEARERTDCAIDALSPTQPTQEER